MPSKRPNSRSIWKTKKRPNEPYNLEAKRANETLRPPLPPGEESMLDLCQEVVKKMYPAFIPRNSIDIITMAAPGYDGPTDQESICAHVDKRVLFRPFGLEDHNIEDYVIRSDYVDATIGRMRATDLIGAKPRPGQKVWTQVMPSWPEYSIRLWVSSSDMRLFGMDFVESATGTPVNLSHRFRLHGTDIIGDYVPILPLNNTAWLTRTQPIGPGEELYNILEEQTITIQDLLEPMPAEVNPNQGDGSEVVQKTYLRFQVPRHPVDPPMPPGVKYDDIHWSLDS